MNGLKNLKHASGLIEKALKVPSFSKISARSLVNQAFPNIDSKHVLVNTNNLPVIVNTQRYISTSKIVCQITDTSSKELFYLDDHRDKGYVVLRLNKAPVNSLNLEFLTALNIQLDKIEQSKDIKGVILTSNLQNIFSAGLDILEMYDSKTERIRQFWSALQNFWIKLYGSSKIYIAAINGHSPAGGCLMSISCDYRVMAKGPYKIGLNETLLGITAPFWFKDTLINTIGHRESEKALQLGKLYSAEEALAINLVDEIVDPKDVMAKAEEQMAIWCKIPAHARELTKSSMRQETISYLQTQKESDIDHFANFITKESIQKSLGFYLESLKKPKKPKA